MTYTNLLEPILHDDKLDDTIYEYFTQVVNYCNDLLDYFDNTN